MPLTQVRNSIWTPGGEVAAQKDVVLITDPRILRMLSWLHTWAADQQINIFCKRCERPIAGQNNDSSEQITVSCQCREWRWAGGK